MQSDHDKSALERPLEVYRKHQEAFASEHHGQYVVIHSDDILGFYDDELDAYYEAKSRYKPRTFLLRLGCCSSGLPPERESSMSEAIRRDIG